MFSSATFLRIVYFWSLNWLGAARLIDCEHNQVNKTALKNDIFKTVMIWIFVRVLEISVVRVVWFTYLLTQLINLATPYLFHFQIWKIDNANESYALHSDFSVTKVVFSVTKLEKVSDRQTKKDSTGAGLKRLAEGKNKKREKQRKRKTPRVRK